MGEHEDNLSSDDNLRTKLEALYDRNNDSNILAQFDIDSKYYEIDEMKQINCHTTSDGFKYKILHLNIQGLMSSLENLKHFLNKLESNDIHIDFILLCETFLNEPNQQMHCSIAGYEFICRNRIKRKKGGVAIYINNRYQFKIKDEISTFVEGEYESIFIEVLSNPHNLIIGEIYRIPNTPAQLSLNRYEDSLNKILVNKSHDIIIGTDQNFDYLKISDHKNTADLFNIFISHGLIPVITRPTRITHNSATLIDNIYIKLQQTHLASGIITTHLSDHLPIFAFYGKKTKTRPEPITKTTRKLTETNIIEIRNKLERYDWAVLDKLTSNDAYNIFLHAVTNIIDNVAPMKTINLPTKRIIREPWMTKGILKSSNNLDKLYKRSIKKHRDHPFHKEFRTYRNNFNKLKKLAKQQYYHNLFNKYHKDIRKTWEVMRSIIKKTNDRSSISESFKLQNKSINDPGEIANGFCDYFSSVGPILSQQIPTPRKTYRQYMRRTPPENSLFFAPTDPNEIRSIIKLLKPKKSSGMDNLSSWLLKELNSYINVPLSIIINKSMQEGIFPDKLKIAKIIPIYKSKDKEQFSNYRPISLLSSVSKIYEKIIYKRLYNYIEPALYEKQFGFRSKRSTIHAILEFCTDIIESFENKQVTMATFLDLSKAFDTIDHRILINKLQLYGIRGIALKWFESYLTNRQHYIQYKSHSSFMNSITTGVPQGSVLGPLLFIIYSNDLPLCLSDIKTTKCLLFADDTAIYETSSDVTKLYKSLNANLNTLADWFRANKLSLNVSKTIYMIFEHSPKQKQK
jgi:hypothetical protein